MCVARERKGHVVHVKETASGNIIFFFKSFVMINTEIRLYTSETNQLYDSPETLFSWHNRSVKARGDANHHYSGTTCPQEFPAPENRDGGRKANNMLTNMLTKKKKKRKSRG